MLHACELFKYKGYSTTNEFPTFQIIIVFFLEVRPFYFLKKAAACLSLTRVEFISDSKRTQLNFNLKVYKVYARLWKV